MSGTKKDRSGAAEVGRLVEATEVEDAVVEDQVAAVADLVRLVELQRRVRKLDEVARQRLGAAGLVEDDAAAINDGGQRVGGAAVGIGGSIAENQGTAAGLLEGSATPG